MSAVRLEVQVPDLGEGVDSGTVVAIRVRCGESVLEEQTLLELETDKVTLEIPAPCAGVVTELRCATNDVLLPGAVVIVLETASSGSAKPEAVALASPRPAVTVVQSTIAATAVEADVSSVEASSQPRAEGVPAGPSARREARQLGVSIAAVNGSGARGRITREDVRGYVRNTQSTLPPAAALETPALPDVSLYGPIRRERLTAVENAIARNMARTSSIVAQAWVGRQIDITELESARRTYRSRQAAGEAPLTLTAILCKAVTVVLAAHPRFNAAFDSQVGDIVFREYCHLGIAVDTPRGLIVPVLRDAERCSVRELAARLQALSEAARNDHLAPECRRGAGFTVSNLGGLGIDAIQPLVNWPEVAILGVARGARQLVKTSTGIDERLLLPVTLGFDHRVIHGADAARFLEALGGLLSEPIRLLIEA